MSVVPSCVGHARHPARGGLRVVWLRGFGLSDGRRGRPTLSPTPLRTAMALGGGDGVRFSRALPLIVKTLPLVERCQSMAERCSLCCCRVAVLRAAKAADTATTNPTPALLLKQA